MKKNERYFGCHVSSAGGFEMAVRNAVELNVNSIQIHPAAPQRWNSKPFPAGFENLFNSEIKNSPVQKVFFHGIYLINLATPDPKNFHLSKTSLVHYLDLMSRINGDGVIFHVGSMKDQDEEDAGFERVIEGINWILSESKNNAKLIMEVAAGSGRVIGSRLEQLARIYAGIEPKERVAFALDTQHMWASGYDWQENLDQIVNDVDKIFGLDKVLAVHLNDSKTACGSKKDRHEDLGKGLIGRETIQTIIHHSKLQSIPIILETPALKEMESAAKEIEILRDLLNEQL